MILAIDQGSRNCGWALITPKGTVLESGVFKLKGKDRRERYVQLIDYIFDFFEEHSIKSLAIEDIFLKRSGYQNPKTLAIMGETRGIIVGTVLKYTHNITDVNPAELIKFLGINPRKQDKKQMTQLYVKSVINRDPQEDEADAVLIGLIAFNKIKEVV